MTPRRGAPWPAPREGGRGTETGCRRRRSGRSSPRVTLQGGCISASPIAHVPSPIRAHRGRRRRDAAFEGRAGLLEDLRRRRGCRRSETKGTFIFPQRAMRPGIALRSGQEEIHLARSEDRLRLAGGAGDGEEVLPGGDPVPERDQARLPGFSCRRPPSGGLRPRLRGISSGDADPDRLSGQEGRIRRGTPAIRRIWSALFPEADAEKPQAQGLADERLRGRGGPRQHHGAFEDLLQRRGGRRRACFRAAAAFLSRGAGQAISAPRRSRSRVRPFPGHPGGPGGEGRRRPSRRGPARRSPGPRPVRRDRSGRDPACTRRGRRVRGAGSRPAAAVFHTVPS